MMRQTTMPWAGAWTTRVLAIVAFLAAGLVSASAQDTRPCRILVTNDDGIGAPGIAALYRSLKDICEVLVVAPAVDRSGTSHSIPDARQGFAARPVEVDGDKVGYSVDGTPAEAVALGLIQFGVDRPFDLVVSGIDNGENTGLANLYSGTVNAGMEGLVRGVPAIAISQSGAFGTDYTVAAAFARMLVRRVLKSGLPKGIMLNVNIPKPATGEVLILPSAGLSLALTGFTATPLAQGGLFYRPNFRPAAQTGAESDTAMFAGGRITIAPLALDRTAYGALAALRSWNLSGERP